MSSTMTSFPDESHRKKRRKIDDSSNTRRQIQTNQLHWKTSLEQQSYSSKLIAALRRVRHRTTSPPSSISVRDAADKALAIAAKGRSHWSRAILNNRLKLRLRNHKKAKIRSRITTPPPLQPPQMTAEGSKSPPLEKRMKALGRLVPGCRKLSFPNLLEETSDYIAALQMQVRAMAALAELLSGSSSSTGLINSEPVSSSVDRDNPVH